MLAATATVIVATGQSPANIIILSLTVVSVSFVGLGAYRMLAPLVSPSSPTPPMTIGGRTRIALEREKTLVLRSIKELEFDFAMGKIAQADFDEMSGRLRARALGLMRQLDAGGGYKEQIAKEVESGVPRATAQPSPERGHARAVSDAEARVVCSSAGRRTIPTRGSARTAERSCDRGLATASWRLRSLLVTGYWLLLASAASAQVDMPDPSRDRGHAAAGAGARRSAPSPCASCASGWATTSPARTVTLKVGADTRTAKTDAQGRAQFDGLTAGATGAGHDRPSTARR